MAKVASPSAKPLAELLLKMYSTSTYVRGLKSPIPVWFENVTRTVFPISLPTFVAEILGPRDSIF